MKPRKPESKSESDSVEYSEESVDSPEESDSDNSSDMEWQLLDDPSDVNAGPEHVDKLSRHDLETAPLLTRDAFDAISNTSEYVTQYGVLGKVLSTHHKNKIDTPIDQRLYINTNAPFSAIVCGVQGSGKSHTVAAILENMLIPNFSPIGNLSKPLSGLVLHFGEGGRNSRPSEAAWLSASISSLADAPPVCVYVSHSSLQTMRAVYAPLGNRVVVEPLYFKQSELDAAAFLSMMSVGSSDSAPLYMQVILSILRELGEKYTYKAFIADLEASKRKFNPAQLSGLEQRMSLLTSFLDPASVATQKARRQRFMAGQLTIIDLSDPFIDSSAACGLFEIVLRLFIRADVGTGKVLVVDEAHKYLSALKGSSGLTNSLLTLVRQQRHLAMRVIISTQEPTVVPPVLLDLCTVSILHRFSSPSWWQHLIQHVSADLSNSDAFDRVVKLQTGQAIILAPSGLAIFKEKNNDGIDQTHCLTTDGEKLRRLAHFGRRYIIMKTRRRITKDGGASILVISR